MFRLIVVPIVQIDAINTSGFLRFRRHFAAGWIHIRSAEYGILIRKARNGRSEVLIDFSWSSECWCKCSIEISIGRREWK